MRGHPAARTFSELRSRGGGRTTDVARTYLTTLAAAKFSSQIHDVLEALATGNASAVHEEVQKVMGWGSTSGGDCLLGIVIGLGIAIPRRFRAGRPPRTGSISAPHSREREWPQRCALTQVSTVGSESLLVARAQVCRGMYRDSVELMRAAAEAERTPGVRRAALMMGTPANRALLSQAAYSPTARRGRDRTI